MISFYNDGHPIFGSDGHSFVATKMFRIIRNDPTLIITKATHPKERQDAKAVGFKLNYGGGAFTLKDDFGVEEDVAQEFIDGYFSAFPTLLDYHAKVKKEVIEKGYIEIDPITGRKWFSLDFTKMKALHDELSSMKIDYPKDYKDWDKEKKDKFKKEAEKKYPGRAAKWSLYMQWKGKLERSALNFPIQGAAGSMTKYAAVLFRDYQIKNNNFKDYYLINLVHDEILVESDPIFSNSISIVLKECMEKAGTIMCQKVKMGAVPVIAKIWGH